MTARTPAGSPTGGQFAAATRSEAATQSLEEFLAPFDTPVFVDDGDAVYECPDCGSSDGEDYYGDGDFYCPHCDEDDEDDPL